MSAENYTLNTTEKIYRSIDDLPIWNWIKVFETNDLTYLYKGVKGKFKTELIDIWTDLQDQYLYEFGLDNLYKKKLSLIKEKTLLTLDLITTGDKFNETLIEIIDLELSELNKQKSTSFWQIKEVVEKDKGFRINPKEVTVIEWYYSLKNLQDGKTDKG